MTTHTHSLVRGPQMWNRVCLRSCHGSQLHTFLLKADTLPHFLIETLFVSSVFLPSGVHCSIHRLTTSIYYLCMTIPQPFFYSGITANIFLLADVLAMINGLQSHELAESRPIPCAVYDFLDRNYRYKVSAC